MEKMPRRGFSSPGFEQGGESEFDAAVRRIVTVVMQERSGSLPRMTLPEWEVFVRGVLTDPLGKT